MMGITAIKFKHFAIGCIGMIPGTVVYVFIGTTVSDIASIANGTNQNN